MRTTRIACTLLFVAAAAHAQVKESITVNYVEVPVTVVDRSGNPIRGLTQANFEVTDDGKKRDIGGFEAIDFASQENGTAPAAVTPAARRNFLLLFDLTFSSPASLKRAQAAARNFATKMAGRDDRIAVASVDVAHGFRLLTSFTTDHALVDTAIANPVGFTALDPLQLAGARFDKEVTDVMNAPTSGGRGKVDDPIGDSLAALDTQQDAYNRDKIDRQVSLLGGLATTLRSVRGQKHIVLLSEGFDPRLVQGRDAGVDRAQQQKENDSISHGEIWNVNNDDRYGSATSMSLVGRLTEIAKRSDVVLDAIDIQGVRGEMDARTGYQHKSNEGLHLLASSTGGTVFQNSNDLGDNFQRALKSQDVVYVLAFQAPASQPGKFHNLKVKLVNVPGGRANARSGYFEAGAGSAAEATLTNAEIIVNDIAQDGIHVASLAAPFATSGERAQVPVIVEINGSDIANAADSTATLEVFTYAFDSEGSVRDSIAHRVGLDIGKLGATLKETGVKYYETLSLPAGKYSVKTLVRVAESDKKGYVHTDIVVPEKDALAVSQPLFYEAGPKWVMIRGTSHDKTNAGYPFQANGESFIPSAAVHVKSGEARRFALFVQNAAPGDLTFETQPDAKVVSKSGDATGSRVVFELAGASAPPTTVRVSVKKKGSDAVQTASVAVVP
ncbi:MAG TPA: VWA domain-containing protein [Thermoanaerobaculia bacterium]|jgi:VWFA-related protein|nr:VWA domain-containing protein [Thermoanaerobaculia bacterium]